MVLDYLLNQADKATGTSAALNSALDNSLKTVTENAQIKAGLQTVQETSKGLFSQFFSWLATMFSSLLETITPSTASDSAKDNILRAAALPPSTATSAIGNDRLDYSADINEAMKGTIKGLGNFASAVGEKVSGWFGGTPTSAGDRAKQSALTAAQQTHQAVYKKVLLHLGYDEKDIAALADSSAKTPLRDATSHVDAARAEAERVSGIRLANDANGNVAPQILTGGVYAYVVDSANGNQVAFNAGTSSPQLLAAKEERGRQLQAQRQVDELGSDVVSALVNAGKKEHVEKLVMSQKLDKSEIQAIAALVSKDKGSLPSIVAELGRAEDISLSVNGGISAQRAGKSIELS